VRLRHRRPKPRPLHGNTLAYTPGLLVEYPFETILAVWGVLGSLPLLFGTVTPPSLSGLLSGPVYIAFKVLFTLGSFSLAWGLHKRRWRSLVPRSLQLIGCTLGVYALALFSIGKPGVTTAGLFLAIALLCYMRAWWLKKREVIRDEIVKSAKSL
jgi:hypothetical protein